MNILFVVDNPRKWPLEIPGVEVVAARDYLADERFSHLPSSRVFNLTRSYRYQTTGYYVSLLAAARGHKPIPDVNTLRDLSSPGMVRMVSGELRNLADQSLSRIHSDTFTLSIYFGRNLAKRYDALSGQLFNAFRAPMLRAEFVKQGRWELRSLRAIAIGDVPDTHHEFLVERAREYFAGRGRRRSARKHSRFDLAILVNPDDPEPPSDEKALKKFMRAAAALSIDTELITRNEFGRLLEFDALFIRETTAVNHHTYRFARRAEAEGLVVIDDPQSILTCTNKVYLAELLRRHRIRTPKSLIVHRDNMDTVHEVVGLPCILKEPDSAFSRGVVKVETTEQLKAQAHKMLASSDLLLAQEFVPTPFDWRIGLIDGRPLYACRYHMAPQHWQIIHRDGEGGLEEGNADTLRLEDVPPAVVSMAVNTAKLIGNGLYGVDLKEVDGKPMVIEINDNPSINAGCEDEVLQDELYRVIAQTFLTRLEARRKAAER